MSYREGYNRNGSDHGYGGYSSGGRGRGRGGSGRGSTRGGGYSSSRGGYNDRYQNDNRHRDSYQSSSGGGYRGSSRVQKPGGHYGQQRRGHYGDSRDQYTPHQLWMGDIDPQWSDAEIRQVLLAMGHEPTLVKLIQDRTGVRGGYCFVYFATQQAASAAIEACDGQAVPEHPGRLFKLKWASGSSGAAGDARGDRRNPQAPRERDVDPVAARILRLAGGDGTNTVYVSEIGPEVTEHMVFDAFNTQYPMQIRQVKLDYPSSEARGVAVGAIVRFNSLEATARALTEMNGVILGSQAIKVSSMAESTSRKVNYSKVVLAQAHPSANQYTSTTNACVFVGAANGYLGDVVSTADIKRDMGVYGEILLVEAVAPSAEPRKDKTDYHLENGGFLVRYLFRHEAERAILHKHGDEVSTQGRPTTLWATWGPQQDGLEVPIYGRLVPNPANKDSPLIIDDAEPVANSIYVHEKRARLELFAALK